MSVELAVAVEGRADAGPLAEVGHLGLQGADQAVVVERGRAQRAGDLQQLVHGPVDERLGLPELGDEAGRRVVHGRAEAELDRGERLVDLVVEVLGDLRALLLLGADDGAAGRLALVLQALEHAVEAGGERLDLLGGVAVDLRAPARLGQVDLRHRPHQALERLEPVAQQQRVEEDDQQDGDDQQADARDGGGVLQPRAS